MITPAQAQELNEVDKAAVAREEDYGDQRDPGPWFTFDAPRDSRS